MKIYVATPCKVENCIFNRLSTCTIVDRPSIDETGTCEQLTMLNLDEDFRELEKSRQLHSLEASGVFPLPERFG